MWGERKGGGGRGVGGRKGIRMRMNEELAQGIMEANAFKIFGMSQQNGDPGKPVVFFHSKSEGQRTRRADGVFLLQRPEG